ncbi:MAG TPA: response regulator [Sediminispirochaeta sp.]|nr:response regulator [Sediminispirochaeta sp.]
MSKILVVDDDSQIRLLLRTVLEEAGYEVIEAEEGKSAVKIYSRELISVVILDMLMPDMEGVETIRSLRAKDSEVKVIALSGGGRLPGEYYLQMMKPFKPQYTFVKPIDPDVVLEAVGELLRE